MTKEELEQAIKNEETVYGITEDDEILEIYTPHLHKPTRFGSSEVLENETLKVVYYNQEENCNVFEVERDCSNIYKTKEEAEWARIDEFYKKEMKSE